MNIHNCVLEDQKLKITVQSGNTALTKGSWTSDRIMAMARNLK